MIFLIDDNKYSQMSENYKFDFTTILLSNPEHIKWLQTISADDIEKILSSAACILIHDSLDDKEEKERLIAMVKKNNIPYCIFSNGFIATVFEGESIKEIKKDRLYNNLLVFLNNFKTESKVELKLLSLGQNYEAEKASIIQDRLINGALFKNRNNFNYEIAFPSGSQDYKDLRELVYLSESYSDKDAFENAYNNFEDVYNDNRITSQMMKEIINSLTNKVIERYE